MFREKTIGYVVVTRKMLILQAFRHFTYITAHSPTLPLLYLRHSSFSNSSVAPPMSQLILQPFFRFSYVTGFFTYVTWRAAHEMRFSKVCYFMETLVHLNNKIRKHRKIKGAYEQCNDFIYAGESKYTNSIKFTLSRVNCET